MEHLIAPLLLALPLTVAAQKSVTEYTPAQRAALQAFIAKNPRYQFIPETWFEAETLKAARIEWGFGRNFKPYYQTEDFNRDGKRDFAVILLAGKNVSDPSSGMHVVVFNGARGGNYRVAHIEQEDFSTALFISVNRTLFMLASWRQIRPDASCLPDAATSSNLVAINQARHLTKACTRPRISLLFIRQLECLFRCARGG